MPALPMRHHARDKGVDAIDYPAEIHAQAEIPIGISRVLHPAADIDAGIVAQDLHGPEGFLRLVRRAAPRFAVRHVEHDRQNVPRLVPKRRMRVIECGLPDIGNHHFHAGIDESLRHAQADPARRAGDESHLSLEILHRSSRLVLHWPDNFRPLCPHLTFGVRPLSTVPTALAGKTAPAARTIHRR